MSALEEKWIERWSKEKLFEVSADSKKKKFFVNWPYPYMNGDLHIGHFYTSMRTDAFARYKRLRGFNVLFPQGWHCTGSPIEAAAARIREGEEKQLTLMRDSGYSEEEIKKFEDPVYWTEYYPKQGKIVLESLGYSIDWRRSFITTDLNKYYDAFIRWQFHKLKEQGFIEIGSHPVVWDPKTNMPVGDHDRVEGEGETPQEFTLIKHVMDDGKKLLSATLRQDTVHGITNVFVKPGYEYAVAECKGEKWILSESCVTRLKEQGHVIKKEGTIVGDDIIGQQVEVFGGRKVLILPAEFINPDKGTGIVHSVPAESPDDMIAIQDLQKDEATCKKYNVDVEKVKAIKPIPVLVTPGYSDIPAKDILEKYGITSQKDAKLDEAKKELYKISHHSAEFNALYKKGFSKNLAGKKASDYKDFIRDELIEQGYGETYYELTGKVVTRSLTEATVKIVENQWFLLYGKEEWKKLAKKALDQLTLYPDDASREQFEYVIDWLNDWACTREFGLGTNLPWDEEWKIESLSDSTIYMAYYTIAHLIENVPIEKVNDEFFDYVFLGKGEKPGVSSIDEMKQEFDYWYPFDFRNSGKDLIQNHLTFALFNHAAIFPAEKWPSGFGTNGFVTVDGEKMSKSKGNIIMLKEMSDKFGVDAARLTILSGGEGLDDPNWDSAFAVSMGKKLRQWTEFVDTFYDKGREEREAVDNWAESKLHEIIRDCQEAADKTLFRTASQKAFFEINQLIKWYMRRTNSVPNKDLINTIIESQIILMVPYTPFHANEIWEKIGKKGFVEEQTWPAVRKKSINEELNQKEQIIENVMKDIYALKKLLKDKDGKAITLYVAPQWKYDLVKESRNVKSLNVGEVLKQIMKQDMFKDKSKEVSKLVPKLLRSGDVSSLSREKELEALKDAIPFFASEFDASVYVEDGEKSQHNKAANGLPGKPAIMVE